MWYNFRTLQKYRLPLVIVVLACVLIPPIVWRVLIAVNPTPSTPPAAPSVAATRFARFFLSDVDKFSGKVIQLKLPEFHNASEIGSNISLPTAAVDDDQRGLAELTKLGLMKTQRESFQFVFDSRRQKIIVAPVNSFYVRLEPADLETNEDGSQPTLVLASSYPLRRGLAFDSFTGYLYFVTRSCAASLPCDNSTTIYRTRIGRGFVLPPEMVLTAIPDVCQILADNSVLDLISLQAEGLAASRTSVRGSLGAVKPESSHVLVRAALTNSSLSCSRTWAAAAFPTRTLFLSSDAGLGIFDLDRGAPVVSLMSDAVGPVSVDPRDSSLFVFSTSKAMYSASIYSTSESVRAFSVEQLVFSFAPRSNWVTDLLVLSCAPATSRSACVFRPGLEALDFSNLMVSVVVILGIVMASGPLLLMYSERVQRNRS